MMNFKLKAYSLQEIGQKPNQEDSLFPALGASTPDDRLFMLCDGMGGHAKGEVASSTVCQVISDTILAAWHPGEPLHDDLFQQALSAAFDALDAKNDGDDSDRRMGTTMTFLCLHANGATVAHIGDSRVYQFRPAKDGQPAHVVFRTRDHSLVNDLVKIGEITEEEAKHHPQKNVITRAMQPCQERRVKADIAHLTDIQSGDYFFLCSDGMLEETTDDNLVNVLCNPNVSDKEKIEMLRRLTKDNKDNHTAHLIHLEAVEGTVVLPEPEADSDGTWMKPIFSASRREITTAKVVPPHRRYSLKWVLPAAVLVAAVAISPVFLQGDKEDEGSKVSKDDTIRVEKSEKPIAPKYEVEDDEVESLADEDSAEVKVKKEVKKFSRRSHIKRIKKSNR